MTNIAIVGAGIAGLHLGLLLRRHGLTATIYTDWTPDQLRRGRLLNNIIRFAPVRDRERELGITRWDAVDTDTHAVEVFVGGEAPLAFRGRLSRPGSYVDMRLYLPALLEDFAARGGRVVVASVQPEDVVRLSERHDLVVIASGRGSLLELFPRVAECSPYASPKRRLALGYFDGLAPVPSQGVVYVVAPGQGEIFQTATYSFGGKQSALLFEAIPGGAFDKLTRMSYNADPARFDALVLELLRAYAPPIYARVDQERFGITRPLDVLQGAIVPTVRRGYAALENGKFVVALGDVHVLNDPLIAQGANTASYAAAVLGEAILGGFTTDELFCRRVEERIWAYAGPVTEWSNAMLQPLPPHVRALLVAATQNQAIADAFADGFADPLPTWELLRDPARVAALLDTAGRGG
jgi:2-polyprenyl-6-methoxyphenol hydroxylase-like FAD-dependent oxidoreductase